jgi:hypothetical protein
LSREITRWRERIILPSRAPLARAEVVTPLAIGTAQERAMSRAPLARAEVVTRISRWAISSVEPSRAPLARAEVVT